MELVLLASLEVLDISQPIDRKFVFFENTGQISENKEAADRDVRKMRSSCVNGRNAVVKLDANVAKEVHAKKIVSVARKVANVGRTVNVKATNVAVMRNVVEVKRNAVLRVRNAVKRKHAASRCNRLRLDLWRYGTIGSTVINSISLLLFFFA
ncbi:hypothetical protein RB195_008820 [Necator americanus]|uniref:Uncharacterized protein n=1 Tax=Necator americanus TaxID=51031 RepID=A0ABR1CQH5_NECAM